MKAPSDLVDQCLDAVSKYLVDVEHKTLIGIPNAMHSLMRTTVGVVETVLGVVLPTHAAEIAAWKQATDTESPDEAKAKLDWLRAESDRNALLGKRMIELDIKQLSWAAYVGSQAMLRDRTAKLHTAEENFRSIAKENTELREQLGRLCTPEITNDTPCPPCLYLWLERRGQSEHGPWGEWVMSANVYRCPIVSDDKPEPVAAHRRIGESDWLERRTVKYVLPRSLTDTLNQVNG